MHDVMIVGAGAAGLTAAIYSGRAGADVLVIDKYPVSGGQMNLTDEIANYPGLENISGMDIGSTLRKQAEKAGAEFAADTVIKITDGKVKKIISDKREYTAKTVIYAAGADHRKPDIKGEDKFLGKGFSYCAVCDGGFYKGKTAAVIGGGDTALKEALYLSEICSKVYLIHRRSEFRGNVMSLKKCEERSNIEILWNTVCTAFSGDDRLTGITLETDGREYTLECSGVFAAVGMIPVTGLVKDICKTDGSGYIVAGEDCKTTADGIFAAGDVRTKPLRQIITACADGANAAESAADYIKHNFS